MQVLLINYYQSIFSKITFQAYFIIERLNHNFNYLFIYNSFIFQFFFTLHKTVKQFFIIHLIPIILSLLRFIPIISIEFIVQAHQKLKGPQYYYIKYTNSLLLQNLQDFYHKTSCLKLHFIFLIINYSFAVYQSNLLNFLIVNLMLMYSLFNRNALPDYLFFFHFNPLFIFFIQERKHHFVRMSNQDFVNLVLVILI